MRYRYSKTLGEFLVSKQDNKKLLNNQFDTNRAYNLTQDFVSGSSTNSGINSFLSKVTLQGYLSKDYLVAWWRTPFHPAPIKLESLTDARAESKLIKQSTAVKSSNLTPSKFISEGSVHFDGTADGLLTVSKKSFNNLSFATDVVTGGGWPPWKPTQFKDTPFTVSFWARVKSTTPDSWIIAKGTASSPEWGTKFVTSNNQINFRLYRGSDIAQATSSTTFAIDDTWVHVVITYDGKASTAAGGTSYNGIKMYKNGTEDASVTYSTAAGYAGMRNKQNGLSLGYLPASTSRFVGHLADVAVWGRVLSANEIANIYNAADYGVYRLVRDYTEKGTLAGYTLGTPSVVNIGLDAVSAESDAFRQGINIGTLDHLTSYIQRKARPNVNFINTLDGRDTPRNSFNDNLSPSSMPVADASYRSGSIKSRVGHSGRLGQRISHEIEDRDLGMTDVYADNEPFYDVLTVVSGVFNPVELVKIHPLKREFPIYMVDHTNASSMDGVIEPLPIREIIDGTSTEIPFHSRGFRADLGGVIDSFRRSIIIDHGYDLNETGATPFLDAVESMGLTGSTGDPIVDAAGSIDIQGRFYQGVTRISPYVEKQNDLVSFMSGSISIAPGTVGAAVASNGGARPVDKSATGGLVFTSSIISNNSNKNFDIMGRRGFVFNNDETNIDSIAYGGWKK